MCYSGNCTWEDFMGDCRFPSYLKSVKEKYPDLKCLCPCGDETPEEIEKRISIEEDIKILMKMSEINNLTSNTCIIIL
ncbi:MAG: hypothetical protein ACOC22_01630 [bacterium]